MLAEILDAAGRWDGFADEAGLGPDLRERARAGFRLGF